MQSFQVVYTIWSLQVPGLQHWVKQYVNKAHEACQRIVIYFLLAACSHLQVIVKMLVYVLLLPMGPWTDDEKRWMIEEENHLKQ